MVFNSFEFVWFLLIVLVIYSQLKHRAQNLFLLGASYWFYGRWNEKFLLLIVLTTLIDYIAALRIEDATDERRRKTWLWLSMVSNLGVLFVFKYYGFFAESLVAMLQSAGLDLSADSVFLQITLPVGISFYTFQSMSYTIDVYRRDLKASRSVIDFSLYVAFFPQLVAGPIERATTLLPRVTNPRFVTVQNITSGSWLIFLGLFKKVVIADNLGRLAQMVFDTPNSAQGWDVLFAVWAFAWQIYGDFSGYSDIARGTSRLFGFELMQNFRMPYFSCNPQEFWNRWHISLSTWLRDYLYIPLGGSRIGTLQTYRNLCLTMFLGGLWHGAAWHFVAWGVLQGLLLVGHRLLCGRVPIDHRLANRWTPLRVLKVIGFFQLICVGWLLFRVNHLTDIVTLFERFSLGGSLMFWQFAGSFVLVVPLLMLHLLQETYGDELYVHRWPLMRRVALYSLMGAGILIFGVRSGSEFIYFQF
ncbi:MAG: MBOAT family O-acyltransferase [Planctomycetaceae bacterium]